MEKLWPQVEITSVQPKKGPAGMVLTIHGVGFGAVQAAGEVTFGGLAASVTAWSDGMLYVILPEGLPQGFADVQVITPEGRAAKLPNAFELTP